MIRAMTPDSIDSVVELLGWCREYQIRGPFPRTPFERFCIGFYQIPQGNTWGNQGPVAWQSYCAASLHFMMAAEGLNLGLEKHLPKTIVEVTENFVGWQALLAHTGKSIQQLLYASGGPHWKRRYKEAVLCRSIASSVEVCLSLCQVPYRSQGLSDEMGILCGDVVIK